MVPAAGWPVMNLRGLFSLAVRLCRTQRKTAPAGGSRSRRGRERRVERRRSQTSQWLHGVMHLWSAAMDCNLRSPLFLAHLFVSTFLPALCVIYPLNEGKKELREQLRGFLFGFTLACLCAWVSGVCVFGKCALRRTPPCAFLFHSPGWE